MTKEIIILSLIVLVIYLYYQQNSQPALATSPNDTEIQDLKNQVNHYQTLYQKRVEKDFQESISRQKKYEKLEKDYGEVREQIKITKELETKWKQDNKLLNDKLTELQEEKKVINQELKKIKDKLGGRDLEKVLRHLKSKDKDIEQLETEIKELKRTSKDLNRNNLEKDRTINELSSKLQNSEKVITNQTNQLQNSQTLYTHQLRQINLLFDENAQNYEKIDFDDLYSLLERIKHEREQKEQPLGGSSLDEDKGLESQLAAKDRKIEELKSKLKENESPLPVKKFFALITPEIGNSGLEEQTMVFSSSGIRPNKWPKFENKSVERIIFFDNPLQGFGELMNIPKKTKKKYLLRFKAFWWQDRTADKAQLVIEKDALISIELIESK